MKQTIEYSVLINADIKTVWHTMLDKPTYERWTKAFHEGSTYEGSWEKGSEMRFIAAGENGNEGMYSMVRENIPYKHIVLEHLGIIKNNVIDMTSEEVRKWAPAHEKYTFFEKGSQTEVFIEMETEDEYVKMFEEMWSKALHDLKELCENLKGRSA